MATLSEDLISSVAMSDYFGSFKMNFSRVSFRMVDLPSILGAWWGAELWFFVAGGK